MRKLVEFLNNHSIKQAKIRGLRNDLRIGNKIDNFIKEKRTNFFIALSLLFLFLTPITISVSASHFFKNSGINLGGC